MSVWSDADARLVRLRDASLLREMRRIEDLAGTEIIVDGERLQNFASNDYLGLTHHREVISAAQEAAARWGAGAGASRLVTGNFALHEELESELAQFKRTESALVFSSGYLANIGLIQVLSERSDNSHVPIVFDRLCHASIIDAVQMSRSRWRSFEHNNVASAEDALNRVAGETPSTPPALILTEGVFSMDGDVAPLGQLLSLAERWDSLLIVDDAHGTGTLGEGGRGTATALGLSQSDHLVQMGTLSKALGSAGGFVCGPRQLRQLLVNRTRAFIFDTALAPASAAGALAALRVLLREPERVERLRQNSISLRQQSAANASAKEPSTPIVPVILQDAIKALTASESLRRKGFLVPAIRPPTVPKGTSRLRLTISSEHDPRIIANLAQHLREFNSVEALYTNVTEKTNGELL